MVAGGRAGKTAARHGRSDEDLDTNPDLAADRPLELAGEPGRHVIFVGKRCRGRVGTCRRRVAHQHVGSTRVPGEE